MAKRKRRRAEPQALNRFKAMVGFESFSEADKLAASFRLAPQDAISYFTAKGVDPTFSWADLMADEHDRAFTVAKMMNVDLLHDVRKAVDEAISTGKTVQWLIDNLQPILVKAGWWGRKPVADLKTGKTITAQLGSSRRLGLIFRTNMQASYAAGNWQQIIANKKAMPWLMFDAVDDGRTRHEHKALDGKIYRVDDKFWHTYRPPLSYNCRCGVIQLSDYELQEMGLHPSAPHKIKRRWWKNPRTGRWYRIPEGIDPSFYQHGSTRSQNNALKSLLREKIDALPKDMQAAARRGFKKDPTKR